MRRTATHMLTMGPDGSHLRPLATNVPPSGCTCGRCGTKPKPKRRRWTDAELIQRRKEFLTEAQNEKGAARRASLGTARDIADVLAERGHDVLGARNIMAGEPGTSVLDD